MATDGRGLDAAEIPEAGTPVFYRVAVENLSPKSIPRNTDTVILSRNRGEVAQDGNQVVVRFRFAEEAHHTLLGIVGVDPFEPSRITITFVQGSLADVKSV